jgi:hypothetical protein
MSNKSQPPGPATDAVGRTAVDPTRNVLDLVDAAVRRQDDLRIAENTRQDDLRKAEHRHITEVATIRAIHSREMREKEADRINAIRSVDVSAGLQNQEVSATQATTLAAQVALSADAMRAQVAATAQASQEGLTRALTPLQAAIDDLRRAQYEQQGKTAQVVETRSAAEDMKPMVDAIERLTIAQAANVGAKAQVVETQAKGTNVGMWIGIGVAALVGSFSLVMGLVDVMLKVQGKG